MISYIQYLLLLLFLAAFAVYFTGTRIYGKRAAIIYVATVVFAPTCLLAYYLVSQSVPQLLTGIILGWLLTVIGYHLLIIPAMKLVKMYKKGQKLRT